jgi:hypothetical protein
MKKLNLLFVLSLVALAACSSVPQAVDSGKKGSPETVEITYHIKLGMESQMQAVLSRAWTIYNKEHLVFTQPHTMVMTREYGNRPRIVESFTWVNHSAPDHAPKSVSDIWNEIQDLCEPRGGHDGVEMIELPTMVPKK